MLASYSYFLFLIYFLLHHFCAVAAFPTHEHIPRNETVSSANETALQEMEDVEKPWTSSPLRRGTNDLLLSCAVTIGLAVWSSILVNIQMSPDATLPRPNYARSQTDIDAEHGHVEKFTRKSTWQQITGFCTFALQTLRLWLDPRHRVRWKYKVLWAFLNVMLPELALAVSLDEWRKSRNLMKALHDLDNESRDKYKRTPVFAKWDMTMSFYAVMGGFYV
ncbi:hypothetical protein EV426DRAFT_110075 [Tirmania nivea]|nr:hypothetical protein EV426DRAFT_110075 [Tirmania nivea]